MNKCHIKTCNNQESMLFELEKKYYQKKPKVIGLCLHHWNEFQKFADEEMERDKLAHVETKK